MNIAFIYLGGRIGRLPVSAENYAVRRLPKDTVYRPSEFFYGAFEMRAMGHEIGIFEVRERPKPRLPKRLADWLIKPKYLPVKMYPGLVDAVHSLLPALRTYDVVVATTPGIAFSITFWKWSGRFAPPIVAIQSAILNYPPNPARVFWTRRLMNRMASQLFGVGERSEILYRYGVDPTRLEVNCFGVDTRFWKPDSDGGDDGYVLAVGNDSIRDFETLVQAARRINNPVVVVTRRQLPRPLPSNVRHIESSWKTRHVDDVSLRKMYRRALAVVVPLKKSLQPSGQSVSLQAMACEKPVVLTETEGIWDRSHLKSERNLLFVSPGDSDDIARAVKLLDRNRKLRESIGSAARAYVLANGKIEQFARRLERRCRSILVADPKGA